MTSATPPSQERSRSAFPTNLDRMSKAELVAALTELQGQLDNDNSERKDLESVLHELNVHQVELEMQNRELRDVQQQLEAASHRYAELFDFAPVSYLTLSERGLIQELNLSTAGLLGQERHLLVGKPVNLYVARESWPTFLSLLGSSRESPDEVKGEVDMCVRERRIPCQIHCKASRDNETGDLIFRIALADISALKENQRKLVDQSKKLEASNKELEQFAFAAAHDLKEPLRKIFSFGDLLKGASDSLDDQKRSYVERIQLAANRMKNLIEDLLQYSRASMVIEDPELTDLNVLVAEIVDLLEPQIKSAKAVITVSELPTVYGSQLELGQLFQNLLGNSIRYRLAERAPVISVSAKKQDDRWLFEVSDNGIGIDPSQKDRIFGLFMRGHNRSRFSGTGVGLALCRKIVEKHGGVIDVDSTVNEGSRFYFTLPAVMSGGPAGASDACSVK